MDWHLVANNVSVVAHKGVCVDYILVPTAEPRIIDACARVSRQDTAEAKWSKAGDTGLMICHRLSTLCHFEDQRWLWVLISVYLWRPASYLTEPEAARTSYDIERVEQRDTEEEIEWESEWNHYKSSSWHYPHYNQCGYSTHNPTLTQRHPIPQQRLALTKQYSIELPLKWQLNYREG